MGAVFAFAVGSCTYDPNYAVGGSYSTGYGGGYGGGYGDGYGYGNSGFSTSLFISTGDSRWGYDPYCYSYYDYRRRCYYDPYLYGYYPVGYRPPVIYGVPHPRGYSRSYCPPPSRVSNSSLTNYHNRESAYRNSSYSWAPQVRPSREAPRSATQFRQQAPYPRGGNSNDSGSRGVAPVPGGQPRTRGGSTSGFEGGSGAGNRSPRLPSSYNVPIKTYNPAGSGSSQAMSEKRVRSNQVQGISKMESDRPMPQAPAKRQAQPPSNQVRAPRASAPAPAPSARGDGNDGNDGNEGGRGKGRMNR